MILPLNCKNFKKCWKLAQSSNARSQRAWARMGIGLQKLDFSLLLRVEVFLFKFFNEIMYYYCLYTN